MHEMSFWWKFSTTWLSICRLRFQLNHWCFLFKGTTASPSIIFTFIKTKSLFWKIKYSHNWTSFLVNYVRIIHDYILTMLFYLYLCNMKPNRSFLMLYWISDPNFVSLMIYINENFAKNAHNYSMVFINDSGNCISAHDHEKVIERNSTR